MAIRLTESRLRQIIREEASRLTQRPRMNEMYTDGRGSMYDDSVYDSMAREDAQSNLQKRIAQALSSAYGSEIAEAVSDTCVDTEGKAWAKKMFPTLRAVLKGVPPSAMRDEYFWYGVNDWIRRNKTPTPANVPQEAISWMADGTDLTQPLPM